MRNLPIIPSLGIFCLITGSGLETMFCCHNPINGGPALLVTKLLL